MSSDSKNITRRDFLKVASGAALSAGAVFSGLGWSKSMLAKEKIKVGLAYSMTGSMAADGKDAKHGALLAIEEINQKGGLLGHELDYEVFDTKELLSETFSAAAETLIKQKGVDMVCSQEAAEAGPDVFGHYEVPYLFHECSYADAQLLEKFDYNENTLMVCEHSNNMCREGPKYIKLLLDSVDYELPNNKVVTVTGGWNYDTMCSKGYKEGAEELGWEVVADLDFQTYSKEFGGALARIRNINPALVLYALWNPQTVGMFVRQFTRNPSDSLLYGHGCSVHSGFTQAMGHGADGFLDTMYSCAPPTSVIPSPTDGWEAQFAPFGNAWKARYKDFWGFPVDGIYQIAGYDHVMLWAHGCTLADTIKDHAAVAKAIKDDEHHFVHGIYRFNDVGWSPATPEFPHGGFQYQDGERKLIGLVSPEPELVPGKQFILPDWIS